MTTTYGLTPQGLTTPTLQVLVDDMIAKLRERFGASLVFSTATFEGFFAGLVGNALAQVWEALQALYAGLDRDAATGAMLRTICSLTGTYARPASASSATITLTGTAGTVVPAATGVRTSSTQIDFSTTEDVSLVALSAWASSHAYAAGARVTNSARAYLCTTAGTSAGSGGPTTAASAITDGTAVWRYLGEGAAAADVLAVCGVTGPTQATSGDLTDITTPLVGLSSAINVEDADLGRDEMSDEALRLLAEQEIAAPGNGTHAAVRANLLTAGATTATIFENDTDTTDTAGVPPHAFEALVEGLTDQEVGDVVWASKPLGAGTYGSTTITVTDPEGAEHDVQFSRPTSVPVYVRISATIFDGSDLSTPPIVDVYPADGDDQIIAAAVAFGDALPVGRDVVPRAIGGRAFAIDGVIDVPSVLVWTSAINASPSAWTSTHVYASGDQVTNDGRQYVCTTAGTSAGSGGPSTEGTAITDGTAVWRFLGAPLVITSRQRASFDTSRTTVVTTSGTP